MMMTFIWIYCWLSCDCHQIWVSYFQIWILQTKIHNFFFHFALAWNFKYRSSESHYAYTVVVFFFLSRASEFDDQFSVYESQAFNTKRDDRRLQQYRSAINTYHYPISIVISDSTRSFLSLQSLDSEISSRETFMRTVLLSSIQWAIQYAAPLHYSILLFRWKMVKSRESAKEESDDDFHRIGFDGNSFSKRRKFIDQKLKCQQFQWNDLKNKNNNRTH